jgi:xanthine dehydrogenase accessory factor
MKHHYYTMPNNNPLLLVRGGGDLASGVILRLRRSGLQVVVSELPQPLAVRRSVSFAEAVYEGTHTIEGVTGRLIEWDLPLPEFQRKVMAALDWDEIPVLIDPEAEILSRFPFLAVIDARLIKKSVDHIPVKVPLHIGVGPGFHAGEDCDAVIETRRSHTLGRVYWHGSAQADSGQPEGDPKRVLRAPADGIFIGHWQIGEHCEAGDLLAEVQAENGDHSDPIIAPLSGVLRGLIRGGVQVTKGLKVGDIDPRDDRSACYLVSDKALSIGGGVLEALLSREKIRNRLWSSSLSSTNPPF